MIFDEATDYYAPKNLVEFLANFYASYYLDNERRKNNIVEFTYDICFDMVHTYGIKEMIAYKKSIWHTYDFERLIQEYVKYYIGYQPSKIYSNIILNKYASFRSLSRVAPLCLEYEDGIMISKRIRDKVSEDTLRSWAEEYNIDENDIMEYINTIDDARDMFELLGYDPLDYWEDIKEIHKRKHYFNDIPIEEFFNHIQSFQLSSKKQLLTDNCIYFVNNPDSFVSIDKIVDVEHHHGLLLMDMQHIAFSGISGGWQLEEFLDIKSHADSVEELIPYTSDSFQKMMEVR